LFLIVGLGNPGARYQRTRHNAGFLVLDRLAELTKAHWEKNWGSQAKTARTQLGDCRVILVKPQTYMNNSGQAVGALARKYQVPPERVIVVVDDLALAPGSIRVRKEGSAGGHSWLKSIIAFLGSGCPRVRLGIGHPGPVYDIAEYVLEEFPPDEWEKFAPVLEVAVEAIRVLVAEGIEAAMNRFNRRNQME